jgi:hypothetical protein
MLRTSRLPSLLFCVQRMRRNWPATGVTLVTSWPGTVLMVPHWNQTMLSR